MSDVHDAIGAFAEEYEDNGLYGATVPTAIQVLSNTVGASLTRQEFAAECDINNIMKGYEQGKAWPGVMPGVEPVYVDFTAVPDNLQEAMNLMYSAADSFMTLSATVRREFDNDPLKFVDFASRSENLGKLREWGLAPPLPKEPPPPAANVGAPEAGGGPSQPPASAGVG